MPNNPTYYDGSVEDSVNAVTANLDSGYLRIYSGSQPALNASLTGTLLASLTFGATAFGAASASGGVVTATANSIANETNAVSGTAGYFALVESDGSTVVGTGTVGTAGSDLNMSSIVFSSGATVACSSFSIVQPET